MRRGGRYVSQHRADAAGLASGTAGARFPPRCGACQNHRAPPARGGAQGPRGGERSVTARDAQLAEEYFRSASALDSGEDSKLEDAAAAYRKALELDPYLVPALINLANIHYSRDQTVEAQALYERAIGLESDFFERTSTSGTSTTTSAVSLKRRHATARRFGRTRSTPMRTSIWP